MSIAERRLPLRADGRERASASAGHYEQPLVLPQVVQT
jgi:hypothetical protein